MSEGILAQIHGEKMITLIDSKYYDELYPYPIDHPHDRQSRIDDIHQPNPSEFSKALHIPRQTGLLTSGSLLYIPYGWWHQLESVGASISISQRWLDDSVALRSLAAAWHVTNGLPDHVREVICAQQLAELPLPITRINRRRWAELGQTQKKANNGNKVEH